MPNSRAVFCAPFQCHVCGDEINRKTIRHCRACGHGCCEHCSDPTISLPQFGFATDQHVCEFCWEAIRTEQRAAEEARAAVRASFEAKAQAASKAAGEDTAAEVQGAKDVMKSVYDEGRDSNLVRSEMKESASAEAFGRQQDSTSYAEAAKAADERQAAIDAFKGQVGATFLPDIYLNSVTLAWSVLGLVVFVIAAVSPVLCCGPGGKPGRWLRRPLRPYSRARSHQWRVGWRDLV